MPIITTTGLDDSVRVQYEADYVEGAMDERIYDQLAAPIGSDMAEVSKTPPGSTISVPFISKLKPSTQTMSQTEDLVTDTFEDATATVTMASRGNAVKLSEWINLFTYTNGAAEKVKNLGENMAQSIDLVAQGVALNGGLVRRFVARASLDAGTAAHRLDRAAFINASSILTALKVPFLKTPRGVRGICLTHPWAAADLAQDSAFLAVGEYQDASLIYNGEIGEVWGFKIIAHSDAKVFYGAGADNGTNIATTLASATKELATTLDVASATSIAVGMRLAIGTEETGSTFYETNESVIVTGIDSTTLTVVGEGTNGGMRYPHAAGVAVRNADNVIPAAFGGPQSLAKVYAPSIGEFGQMVGPKKTGLADQWETLAWKWYGGYGIVAQNRILRGEYSTSLDA